MLSGLGGVLIGSGINILSNAIGSWIGNKRKREAKEAYDAAIGEVRNDITQEINSNYLDSAMARNAIRKQTDANTEAMRQLNTDAIRGGATDEAKVAMASKLNKGTADLVGDLAALGEQRKEQLKQQRRSLDLGQIEHNYALASDTSGIDSVLGSIGQAAQSLGNAWSTRNSTPFAEVSPEVKAMYDEVNKPIEPFFKAGQSVK